MNQASTLFNASLNILLGFRYEQSFICFAIEQFFLSLHSVVMVEPCALQVHEMRLNILKKARR